MQGGQIWVDGPWNRITASPNVDDVIDQLCAAVMELPRADLKEYGQEYCGLIYSVGSVYYSSHPSPLGKPQWVGPTNIKNCYVPRTVKDDRGRVSVLADFHSHPWSPSAMSRRDLEADSQRWMVRIQFDTKCHLQKLVPHRHDEQPGEVYERQGKQWKLIGIIKPEDKPYGLVTAVAEEGS
jgi:hypothetical protein